MTFDEWFGDADTIRGNEDFRACLQRAWEAATESEREACARVAEGADQERDWFPTSLWATLRNEIAARIRKRPNATKLTGLGTNPND